MGLVGVVYKTTKFTYKAYKGYKRVKRIVKTGEIIYNGSKEIYKNVRNINSDNHNNSGQNLEASTTTEVPNNVVQYPVSDANNKPIFTKDNLMRGIDLITWII